MLKVGLLGAGVVGGGVIALLEARGRALGLQLARVAVRDPAKSRPELPGHIARASIEDILADSTIDIVVELMGGREPALGAVRTALERGKDVVTANKWLVAEHGEELRARARERGLRFRYEASVAGCLPIVEIIEKGLIFDQVERLFGILNGTCNFILTRCQRDGLPYAEALRAAQAAGFAEADPTLDVSGADSAQKLAILTTLLSGRRCPADAVSLEGIEAVSPADHLAAEEVGCRIKLIASYAGRGGGEVQLRVAPTLVPAASALGLTTDEYNAVEVECAHIGWQLYLGKGAGRMPTAAAVLHDLREIARARRRGGPGASSFEAHGGSEAVTPAEPLVFRQPEAFEASWLVRIGPENPGWPVSKIGAVFSQQGLEVVEYRRSRRSEVGALVITSRGTLGAVSRAVTEIAALPDAVARPAFYALELDA